MTSNLITTYNDRNIDNMETNNYIFEENTMALYENAAKEIVRNVIHQAEVEVETELVKLASELANKAVREAQVEMVEEISLNTIFHKHTGVLTNEGNCQLLSTSRNAEIIYRNRLSKVRSDTILTSQRNCITIGIGSVIVHPNVSRSAPTSPQDLQELTPSFHVDDSHVQSIYDNKHMTGMPTSYIDVEIIRSANTTHEVDVGQLKEIIVMLDCKEVCIQSDNESGDNKTPKMKKRGPAQRCGDFFRSLLCCWVPQKEG